MVFSSIPFLYYFLPWVLIIYFIVPFRCKNLVLLAASLLFYGWGEPVYVLLMLLSILLGYFFGILLEWSRESRSGATSKWVLGISVSLFTGILIYFKYADFFIANWNAATGLSCPLLYLTLPIGISFYTFQIISYLTDVYRGEVPAQKNILSFALYVAMFPQLIAGPIIRYKTISVQIRERRSTWQQLEDGVERFIIGLSKKVLLANELGALCEIFRKSDEKSVLFYWVYAAAVSLHIYLDFSAYSDMAIGLGSIFGFSFPENFNAPYVSRSITEFWRRWHMSLGTWFRDYVYIPLGGGRVGAWKGYRNILIVWLLTGFWHGAAWNFIVWGLLFAVLLVFEKKCFSHVLQKTTWLAHGYVLFFVMLSFVIFNAADMKQAIEDLRCMFGMGSLPAITAETKYYLQSYEVTLLIGMLGSTTLPGRLWAEMGCRRKGIKTGILLVLLLLCTAYLADGSFNPFLYFRF